MIYSFLAFITGMFLVVTTTFNSRIGVLKSVYKSAFINSVIGLMTSIIVFFIFDKATGFTFSFSEWYILLGGLLAPFIVVISNFTIAKIGVFSATLLIVSGQLIMGTIIDWIRNGVYPVFTTVGGILIILGLLYIHMIEKNQSSQGGNHG
ncbi:MAG: DMT family transporter [Clostridia bacterium]|nr:DMT family transporter [Clostridia bacterium]